MSSSGSGSAVDCGVGSIVWVRRRNGSWWPGKILGPEELASTQLTSPRSGTPVKLLGREDASIDWYNLEKSKRVKAFRCGEFDECIERAEASQGMPPRKREKYARREDAILHALELERQILKKQGKLPDHISSKSSGTVKKGLGSASEKFENDDGKFRSSKAHKEKDNNERSLEENLETVPRTRGLRDFGLRIAPSKRKFSLSASTDFCIADNSTQNLPSGVSVGNASNENGMEQMVGPSRAKRSRYVSLPTDSTDSLGDNRVTPSRLVEMTPFRIQEDNHSHLGLTAQVDPSRLTEESESDSSDTESDSTETEPDLDGAISTHSDISMPLDSEGNALSSEELDDSELSGEMTNIYTNEHASASETVSKWKLKGKRNTRSLTKRAVDSTKRKAPLTTLNNSSRRTLGQSIGLRRMENLVDDHDADLYPEDTRTEMGGLGSHEYLFTPRSVSNYRNRLRHDYIDWELPWENQAALKGHWADRREQFNPLHTRHHHFGGRMRSTLIDVDLQVKGAGYRRESVPMISLTSKVNGQPIVGHPLQIEVLDDGSTETLVSSNAVLGYESIGHDGIASLPPSWKTARRSANSRIPRPHLSSALDGDEYAEELSLSDQERDASSKKSYQSQKSHPNNSHSVSNKKYVGKISKKANLSSGQRTRTLSSIAADQKFSNKHIHGGVNGQMDGPNKSESPGPTTVALIPCKLVFSRLLEKINRPPSKSNTNMLPSNSNTETKLS